MSQHRLTALRPVAALALLGLLAGCSPRQADHGAGAGTRDPASVDRARVADAPSRPAVAASVQAMRAQDLRAAADKALDQNRIYAPAGDNAMEYYLALRDKQPDDPATTSALTDLLPYTVIAAEQSIGRGDFEEARRLQALIAKADPGAPALPRLDQAIASGDKRIARQSADRAGEAKAAEEARTRDAQHVAEQAARQKQAADAPAAGQPALAATPTRPAVAAAAPPPQGRPAAEAAPPAPPPAAVAGPGERRLLSAPAPHYPVDALRANISGQVVVEITIGGDGDVSNVRVVQASPPRVFDRAVLTAIKRWKFEATGGTSTTRRTIAFDPG